MIFRYFVSLFFIAFFSFSTHARETYKVGVLGTLKKQPQHIQDQLRILYTTKRSLLILLVFTPASPPSPVTRFKMLFCG